MRGKIGLILALGLCVAAFGEVTPNSNVFKYTGKFLWVKLGPLPASWVKNFSNAHTISFDVKFDHDVKLKKDANGNPWFTFVVADQGSDFKWNQTTGSGVVPQSGGTIKAGTYTISVPVKGIPSSVLKDKNQFFSVGPNTSGLVEKANFIINHLRAK